MSWLLSPTLVHSRDVTLAWDRSSSLGITGYKIYRGNSSGNYVEVSDAGNGTQYTVVGLDDALPWYFVATAYTGSGAESGYSNEVNVQPLVVIAPATGLSVVYLEVTDEAIHWSDGGPVKLYPGKWLKGGPAPQ